MYEFSTRFECSFKIELYQPGPDAYNTSQRLGVGAKKTIFTGENYTRNECRRCKTALETS